MSSFLHSLKTYVQFSDADAERLRELLVHAKPHFQKFAANFYDRITQHPDAHRVLEGPAQVARLKMTLMKWMRSGLKGPHDEAFYERRSRIGRIHVDIGLPQQYMFTAMNVLRLDFQDLIAEVHRDHPDTQHKTRKSLDKLFDLELAIMLHTYREDSEQRLRDAVRLATIGQLAASISRELKQPLDAIRASALNLAKPMLCEESGNIEIQRIMAQADACAEIIDELVATHHAEPVRKRRVDMLTLLADAHTSVALPTPMQIALSCDAGLRAWADPDLLQQAVAQLISCLLSECRGRAAVIKLYAHALAEGEGEETVAIDVTGQGPGLGDRVAVLGFDAPMADQARTFRLDRVIIKNIIERHGGTVATLPTTSDELTVRLLLPPTTR